VSRPPKGAPSGSAVFTIGYENATPDGLIAALKQAGVATVADVRALANSRRPGFAKRALSAALEQAGIGYWHLPALGTPAEGRAAVRAGRPEAMKPIFLRHLAGTEAQAALGALRERVLREPVCLLCLEADPRYCHRSLVAERLDVATVRHLHPISPQA
jgi:uncharacterized protein (DUF488 family)